MTRHISDSERLTIAMLNKKETELKQTQEKLSNAYQQLKAMKSYINVQILGFEEMKKVEQKYLPRKQKKMPRYNMKPNRLKNLRFRFISFFKH